MITVAILTKNSSETIKKTLLSTAVFDEVIILDTGSTDKTLEIAKGFLNVKIHKIPFEGFGKCRNRATKIAKNDWILALDSDEEISKELIEEINKINLDANYIYSIPFYNFYNDKHIKWCGWHPEYHIRLYNRKKTKFDEALVHEGIVKKNIKIKKMKNAIFHYSYLSIDDFLIKMHKYSSLFAKQNHLRKKSSLKKALFHGIFSFLKSYIVKRGIFGGKEGFIISIYNANTTFYKYLKLAEINNKKCF